MPLDGIEYTFNDELAPQPVGTDTDTVYGNQVFLTIDLDIAVPRRQGGAGRDGGEQARFHDRSS